MITFDTETCGLHGPIVLLQYAVDDGAIILHDVWLHTVIENLRVFDRIINHKEGVCGFNLAFDWFHICQMYTTLLVLQKQGYEEWKLEHIVEQYALAEKE